MFIGASQSRQGIPYTLKDCFKLADWIGRAIRDNKRGYIPQSEPKIIHKLVFASCKTSIYHTHVKNWVLTRIHGWKPLAISQIVFIPLLAQKKK